MLKSGYCSKQYSMNPDFWGPKQDFRCLGGMFEFFLIINLCPGTMIACSTLHNYSQNLKNVFTLNMFIFVSQRFCWFSLLYNFNLDRDYLFISIKIANVFQFIIYSINCDKKILINSLVWAQHDMRWCQIHTKCFC